MLRLATDGNFKNDILRGLLRKLPELDNVRVQDVGLSGADDPDVLAWAAGEGRVLRTLDVDLLLIAACSDAAEWEGQVQYLPLR